MSKSQNLNHIQLLTRVSQNHVVSMASVVHWKEVLHVNAKKDGGKSIFKILARCWPIFCGSITMIHISVVIDES